MSHEVFEVLSLLDARASAVEERLEQQRLLLEEIKKLLVDMHAEVSCIGDIRRDLVDFANEAGRTHKLYEKKLDAIDHRCGTLTCHAYRSA